MGEADRSDDVCVCAAYSVYRCPSCHVTTQDRKLNDGNTAKYADVTGV